jgi:hypothetical protein
LKRAEARVPERGVYAASPHEESNAFNSIRKLLLAITLKVTLLAAAQCSIQPARRMTRDKVQTAINEGIPFMIKMADGEKYEVSDRYRVALGRTTVIVVGNDDMPHILPLLTMTGISYRKPKK